MEQPNMEQVPFSSPPAGIENDSWMLDNSNPAIYKMKDLVSDEPNIESVDTLAIVSTGEMAPDITDVKTGADVAKINYVDENTTVHELMASRDMRTGELKSREDMSVISTHAPTLAISLEEMRTAVKSDAVEMEAIRKQIEDLGKQNLHN